MQRHCWFRARFERRIQSARARSIQVILQAPVAALDSCSDQVFVSSP